MIIIKKRGLLLSLLLFFGGSIMAKKDNLTAYRKKRNFNVTTEPSGARKKITKKDVFVIQKHEASHLHFDLRLAIDGVLVSWAVPKGPSNNPATKRLAIMTENHPMDYAKFEGMIPEGNYGGGAVMVWDTGTYTNIKKVDDKLLSMDECLKLGRIEITLTGKKLKGNYALVRTQRGGGKQWLLIKMNDAYARKKIGSLGPTAKSALSGKTMKEIRKG